MTAVDRELEWAICVEADCSRLADIRRFVEQVSTELSLDFERMFDLKVAVSEACANAMEHAGCQAARLEISASVHAQRLTFVVSDSGMFRPPAVMRSGPNNRGLGLPLMVTLMDEVSFCHAPGGGTKVSLTVQLQSVVIDPV